MQNLHKIAMHRVEITVRNRKFVCPNFTSDHAMFFGTLLMTSEELRVFRDEEDPERATQMMSDRVSQEAAELRQLFAGEADIETAVDTEVVQKMALRMIVRINQDIDPLYPHKEGFRSKLGRRIREVFPDFPSTWVSAEAINLEPDEMIAAIAIPLFGFLAEQAKANKATATPDAPAPTSTAGQGFKPKPVQTQLPMVVPAETEPQEPANAYQLSQDIIDQLSPSAREKLGI